MATREDGDLTDPFAAAQQLHDLLRTLQRSLPAWKRFPDDWNHWTPKQREERCWPVDAWSIFTAGTGGGGFLLTWNGGLQLTGRFVHQRPRPSANIQPPPEIPPNVRTRLEEGWRGLHHAGAQGRFEFLRNEWAERRTLVETHWREIERLIDLSCEAVLRLDGDVTPLEILRNDEFLHTETIANAVRILKEIAGSESPWSPARPETSQLSAPDESAGAAVAASQPAKDESSAADGKEVLDNLEQARNKAHNFLHVAVARMYSLRTLGGMIQSPGGRDTAELHSKFRQLFAACLERAAGVVSTYRRAWHTIIDAVRPEPGRRTAHERVFDMARGFLEQYSGWGDQEVTDRHISALAADVQHCLCDTQEAQDLWRAVEQEHAVAYARHGGQPTPLPNPDLPFQEKLAAMLSPLLRKEQAQRPEPAQATKTPLAPPAAAVEQTDEGRTVETEREGSSAAPDGRLLIGWQAILECLGIEYERKNSVRLRRMNKKRNGPITWVGNKPKVYSGPLCRWIQELDPTRKDDVLVGGTDVSAELNHPAEMKKLGLQPKVRPNNSGSFSRKIDLIP